jgi:hypothetical protein
VRREEQIEEEMKMVEGMDKQIDNKKMKRAMRKSRIKRETKRAYKCE